MSTPTVANQPPPLVDYNPFRTDPVLPRALDLEGAVDATDAVDVFGAKVGSAEVIEWGRLANVNPPKLHTHDQYGNRIDQVEFHPAWHGLLDLAVTHGLHSLPWEPGAPAYAHTQRVASIYLSSQIEAGHFCPISMTTSVVPTLRTTDTVASEWLPRITTRSYDQRFTPANDKTGVLVGMGMTEKQGGSDVRANWSTAFAVNGGGPGTEYRITGHKWFMSAPMCDAFLVLAQAPGGLSCFLVPRWTPDGEVNTLRLMRLKDKVGNRSNASSEVEFDDTYGVLVGYEGRGIPTIIEMVNGTRLDCTMAGASLMRQAVAQAAWHVEYRHAFGSALMDKPLMQNVIADLEVETEVATLMMMRLAAAFDRAGDDPQEAAFKRIALPIAKYWVTKQTTPVVREAMECLGGNGYVEESVMPRLFRESPLNAIWEGSGNVIALDLLRAVVREPESVKAFFVELETYDSADADVATAVGRAKHAVHDATEPELEARITVELLAMAWAGALVVRYGDDDLLAAFVASRLRGDHGAQFGTLRSGLPITDLARRAVPRI
ncbi:MAG: acyl-CoA dehydrogenase family protein [Acidimicrobiia bacterium]|nr:acyl-CoA dehydrogenase family protein [Acidimicrobiia bacterium]